MWKMPSICSGFNLSIFFLQRGDGAAGEAGVGVEKPQSNAASQSKDQNRCSILPFAAEGDQTHR
jgi:hypothetical protein